jgi:hypothetical protein
MYVSSSRCNRFKNSKNVMFLSILKVFLKLKNLCCLLLQTYFAKR